MRCAIAASLAVLLFVAVPQSVDSATRHRLPKGLRWGQCLLVVDGTTRISGKCAYELSEHGGFEINGPRQIYEGIDYQNPDHSGAGDQSRDYWAVVSREPDGSWTGYGNDAIRATHGGQSYVLTRQGSCFVGAIDLGETDAGDTAQGGPVRICLWRKLTH